MRGVGRTCRALRKWGSLQGSEKRNDLNLKRLPLAAVLRTDYRKTKVKVIRRL